MKEFDLEAAKAGKKVMTRDGRNVRIVCFDRKDPEKPIVALVEKTVVNAFRYASCEPHERIEEDVVKYSSQGKAGDMHNDLVMASEKKVFYVNIYKCTGAKILYDELFETYDKAYSEAMKRLSDGDYPEIKYVTTTKLEWEE